MSRVIPAASDIKVAGEVFVATALSIGRIRAAEDFTIAEIVDRAAKENLHGELRLGVRVHASIHCVANLAPSPARYRMLYATGTRTRRLLKAGDDVHPLRTGKIWPEPDSIPAKYRYLIEWAKQRYGNETARRASWIDGILQMRGMGARLRQGEDPDEYVRKLREGWG